MRTRSVFSSRIPGSLWARCALAVAAVLGALLICRGLSPLVATHVLYAVLFPAIAFSAWYCGVGPSALAIALALIGAKYWFIPPIHSFHVPDVAQSISLIAVLFASAVVVAMGEARRREIERLQKTQGELEVHVKERTVELDTANRSLRELSARLLQLQDDERRRIARELHDSVGQMLVALSLNLASVRTDIERLRETTATLTDSEGLVQDMSAEVRTISHLLHPPLLDEAGLSSAVRWYVDGFAKRSKIKVELDIPGDFGRLPRELETAMFRVVQECLTNVHRHSGSSVARIRLRNRDDQVLVEIDDEGKGIAPEKQVEMASPGTPGVGLRGMRERLRQLGGALEIHSNGTGTRVTARLPATALSQAADMALISDTFPTSAA